MENTILAPAAVLVLWSLIMLFWMAATRFPAIAKSGMDLKNAPPGGRGQDLDAVLPPSVNWKAHNYTHLMEQPTIFYAAALAAQVAGQADGVNVALAWTYVILRVVHSLIQCTVNVVAARFAMFALSTIALAVLTIRVALAVF